MSNPTQNAVAVRDNSPRAMVAEYRGDFATVLPTHVRADTFVRVAQGALKRGRKQGNRYELEIAAANNPGAFMAALLDAARLGLEPGTEQFYLTPRKTKGQLEILGIVGWQGYVELMYRAGAVSSVIAEVVRANDLFIWTPGRYDNQEPKRWEGAQVRPYHEIDWFGDRGALKGVYAYSIMKDGSTSKVVILNGTDIDRIKKSSAGADYDSSPWKQHEEAMWLKSAVRQLAKWVPTSAERVTAGAAPVRVEVERDDVPAPSLPAPTGGLDEHHVNYDTGEIHDAEIVEDEPVSSVSNAGPDAAWPATATIPGTDR